MSFLANLLEHYHMTTEDLRVRSTPGSFADLRLPDETKDFQAVVRRLSLAVERKEKVVLYGDYDVDGLTSTAILKIALSALGLDVGFFIPSRYVEGYGLHESRVKQFHEKGYSLIVLVDNGIRCHESIALARSLGMEVLVVDHHLCDSTLPPCSFVFHHRLSGFLDYDCSAASLCYFVARSLLGKDDEYLAFLAGLAVFSDCMPLVGNNLVFAKLALLFQNRIHFPNVSFLLPEKASYEDLSFQLIPTLNAVGRMMQDSMSSNKACWFLIRYQDKVYAHALSQWMTEINQKRKSIVKSLLPVEGRTLETEGGTVVLVDAPSGLAGLYANRLLREKGHPVAVLSHAENQEGALVGSIRATEGFHLMDFLSSQKDRLLAFGGHDLACGVTIKEKDYFQFATNFLSYLEKARLEKKEEHKKDNLPLTLEDLNEENYHTLEMFEPFGSSFPAPAFELTCSTEDIKEEKNYFFVTDEKKLSKAIFFQPFSAVHHAGAELSIFTGSFHCDDFHGRKSYVLMADQYREE